MINQNYCLDNTAIEWYAIKTRYRHEQKVCESLLNRSINTFYPTVEIWSRRKDRRKKIRASLFPGYLFVNCMLTDDTWYAVNSIKGVVGFVGTNEHATSIPQDQINAIHLLLASGLPVNPHPYLNLRDRVVVIDGPLKGARGIYVQANEKKGKLIVSIDTMGRSIQVDIEPHFVDKD